MTFLGLVRALVVATYFVDCQRWQHYAKRHALLQSCLLDGKFSSYRTLARSALRVVRGWIPPLAVPLDEWFYVEVCRVAKDRVVVGFDLRDAFSHPCCHVVVPATNLLLVGKAVDHTRLKTARKNSASNTQIRNICVEFNK